MKKFNTILIAASIFSIIIIFFFGLNTKKIYNTKDLIGKPISEVNLKLLNSENTFNTLDLKKNNFTLINFWASWCAPCRKEHKHLLKLSKNVKILGINFKDQKAKANEFIKKLGNPYFLMVSDYEGKKSVSFGVYGIPETIIVDKNLIIIKKYIGPIDKNDVKQILKIVGNQ